jgi:N-ethylmaleimide reductase
MHQTLFSSYPLGRITLANRIVMSPMTRSRSPGNVPDAHVAAYYAQRATAGLIVTEGTSPSPDGLGYARIPGLFNDAQQAGWKAVTDAVHAAGGKIAIQFMHTGRVGHAANLPAGGRVLGPSAIAAPGEMYTDAQGMQAQPVPAAMTEADIEKAIGEFVSASKRAIAAGFDLVELHGANGYLIDQFLNAASNHRTDRWGGSLENRARFAVEIARRVTAEIGSDRVGIRLSPAGGNGAMVADANTPALYLLLAKEFKALKLAYLHLIDHSALGAPKPPEGLFAGMKEAFGGTFILAGGLTPDSAEAALKEHRADLVAFGRPFLSNPNLVAKFKRGEATLTPFNFKLAYTPGPEGYTDYPAN